MSKVLISFLGTGSQTNGSYRKAEYRITSPTDNATQMVYETSFVADALATHYGVDKIILIGTVKSMWDEVYYSFCTRNEKEDVDENYYLHLSATCKEAKYDSELKLPDIERLEAALGKDSHVMLVRYGLNEEELNFNIAQVLSVEQYLHSGDELIVDITHSFRSLPMLLMNTLIYLKNVSKKRINISHITYGMLDITRELKYTPVIDLKKVMDVNEWISASYSFMEFGNAYKIAGLLEADNSKSQANVLRDFSDVKNLNDIQAIEKQVQRLKSVSQLSPIAEITVRPVINSITQALSNTKSHSEFQFRLAYWHYSIHNYASAYITLVEAIITYVCEQEDLDYSNKDQRDNAKDTLMKNKDYRDLKKIYEPVNRNRKRIAHSIAYSTEALNGSKMIKLLEENLEKFKEILEQTPKTWP